MTEVQEVMREDEYGTEIDMPWSSYEAAGQAFAIGKTCELETALGMLIVKVLDVIRNGEIAVLSVKVLDKRDLH